MAFFVKYLVTAVLLASAVWFGLPKVKAALAEAPRAEIQETKKPRVATPAPRTSARELPSQAGGEAGVQPQPAAPAPAGVETAVASVSASVSVAQPQPQSEPEVIMVMEPEPVQDPTYTGPRYDWGVLMQETQSYGLDGNIRVKLPAGTILEKMEEKNSSNGRVYICRILQNRRWQPGFVIAAPNHVVMFAGPFAEAPKASSDKVVRYFQLQGLIDARKAALREAHVRKNPYFAAYQKVAQEYTAMKEKAEELTKQRDAAQGAARSRLASELERMRNQQTKLASEVEKAEKPYKKWKEQNGDGQEAIAQDAQIAAWDDERYELREDVAEMVPGI